MTTVPDIPVVQVPAFEPDVESPDGLLASPGSIWAVDVPRGRRPSPLTLAFSGVVAGIAAMALGAAAVISAGASAGESPPSGVAAPSPSTPSTGAASVERRVLALLAKTSTERVAFRGARGLVLAVGSAGRAAILVRGLERASHREPYLAWVVTPGSKPVAAARLVGTERAVFLTRALGPRASVVVSKSRPVRGPPALNPVVALRG